MYFIFGVNISELNCNVLENELDTPCQNIDVSFNKMQYTGIFQYVKASASKYIPSGSCKAGMCHNVSARGRAYLKTDERVYQAITYLYINP